MCGQGRTLLNLLGRGGGTVTFIKHICDYFLKKHKSGNLGGGGGGVGATTPLCPTHPGGWGN